jgi:hypothetical protein
MYSNYDVVRRFAEGKTRGKSHSMSIHENELYSYGACIAIRRKEGYIVSNRTSYLGGGSYSNTTSQHISLAYRYLEPNTLVDGWAEEGKEEWIIPRLPSHKTLTGLIKSFAKGRSGWVGRWSGRQEEREFYIEDNEGSLSFLCDKEGTVLAERKDNWGCWARLNKGGSVMAEHCESCPARMICLTTRFEEHTYDFPFYAFWIKEAANEFPRIKMLCKKYLYPYAGQNDLQA